MPRLRGCNEETSRHFCRTVQQLFLIQPWLGIRSGGGNKLSRFWMCTLEGTNLRPIATSCWDRHRGCANLPLSCFRALQKSHESIFHLNPSTQPNNTKTPVNSRSVSNFTIQNYKSMIYSAAKLIRPIAKQALLLCRSR
jgi:hypothetical protein